MRVKIGNTLMLRVFGKKVETEEICKVSLCVLEGFVESKSGGMSEIVLLGALFRGQMVTHSSDGRERSMLCVGFKWCGTQFVIVT